MAALKPFAMPKWGIEMTEGTVAEWMVQEGAAYEKGTLLALIETDKITNEVEAETPGILVRLVASAGQSYAVGTLLAVMADGPATDAEIEAFLGTFKPADSLGSAGRGAPAAAPAQVAAATAAAGGIADDTLISPAARQFAEERGVDVTGIKGSGKNGRISLQDVDQASRPAAAVIGGAPVSVTVEFAALDRFYASPLAKRIAHQNGVDLATVTGTGPRGRICKADVLAKVAPAAVRSKSETGVAPRIVPMDKVRKVIARRLTEAKQSIPHFYLRAEARVDALIEMRRQANLFLGEKASLNDFLVRAVAVALIEVPDCNVQVHGDAIHYFSTADISVAMATDRGLVTPIVRGAESLSPHEIAHQTKALLTKAKAGRLGYEEMEGGSFTISNLGMFGVDDFDAIINPPQGAILAVGTSRRVWGEQADGSGAFESRIAFTLSCDHRAIDGAVGARFLAALKALLERPERLFPQP